MELQNVATEEKKGVFRIAHISDPHVSPEYNRRNILKLKSLLSQVIDEGYDHLVITGDIAGHGEERDFRSVRRILKYFGLLEYEKLTVTIGNHDIFGGVHRAEDLLSFGKHCRSVNYAEKLDLFERAFKETFPAKAYENERIFPFVKIIGPAVFVGMNSVRPFHPILNPFGSNGHVSDRQLDAVERILNHPTIAGLKKIILIHHHFDKYQPYSGSFGNNLYHLFESHTLKLHNKKKVEEVFRKYRVDAVLHGHTHIEEIYSNSGIIYSSTALNPVRSKKEKDESSSGNVLNSHPTTVQEFNSISALSFNEISVTNEGR
ncbi:MAG: metallophosphoesterase, partial [Candidatus Kryptoniota bacterium]